MASNPTMLSARIEAPRTVRIERVSRPRPKADEVLFRVEGTGVCASNLGPWKGLPWLTYPMAPGEGGHEAYGVVEDAGDAVTGVTTGTRIAALSYRAYAEYDVARAGDIVSLPAGLASTPFPGEPIACAMNVFARSRISGAQTVAIVGIGFLGAILVRLAKKAGATVIALSRRSSSLALARTQGADHCIAMSDYAGAVGRVKELTGGAMCPRVIEAVGYQTALDLASELTGERGTLTIAGYHQDGPRNVKMQLWNWRGIDVVNAHERDNRAYVDGMRRGLAATLEGDIDLGSLITHRYGLGDLAAALDATRDKPDAFVKALVVP